MWKLGILLAPFVFLSDYYLHYWKEVRFPKLVICKWRISPQTVHAQCIFSNTHYVFHFYDISMSITAKGMHLVVSSIQYQ